MSPGTEKVQSLKKETVLRDSVWGLYLGTVKGGKFLLGWFVCGQSHAPGKSQNLGTVF